MGNKSRLRLGFQDILLMGMGFRNKQRWENGIMDSAFRTLLSLIYKSSAISIKQRTLYKV